ncbi:MAG: hypothetical protein ACKVOQ_18005 [Cyclobacteriaceae bacterium]
MNWRIRWLVENNEAFLQSSTPFGDMYEVKGTLRGFGVVTVWLLTVDLQSFKFVMLFPNKKVK